jgi:hypothetical protein
MGVMQLKAERRHRGGSALATICGAVAIVVLAGCANSAKSPSPVPTTAASWACSAQPPGCASAKGTAKSLTGFTWSAAPAPPLSPRIAQASVWTGTDFLIWGGMEENQGLTMAGDGAAYDPATRAWTPMPPSPLSPRNTAFAAWTGTRALFWGGGNRSLSLLMNGASYDPASRTWTMLPAAPLPAGIDDLQAIVWTGTQMVVIQPGAGAALDPATRSWTTVPGLPQVSGWQPFVIGANWTGSEVITWVASQRPAAGGIRPPGFRFSAYSWVPGSQDWTIVPTQPDHAFFPFGTAATIGRRLLFLGGKSCGPGASCPVQDFFDGAWFDAASGTWTGLPETYSGGSGPAVWTGSAMVDFATKAGATPGPPNGPPDVMPGAVAAFDPSGGAWTDLPRCPIPDLTNASLAWTGQQLVVVTMDDQSGDTPQVEVLSSPVRKSRHQRP